MDASTQHLKGDASALENLPALADSDPSLAAPAAGAGLIKVPVRPLGRPRFAPFRTTEFHLFPDSEFAVPGVLPTEGIACFYGASGSGKSALIGSLIHSLSTGNDWFGRKVTPCTVWSIALEGQSGQRNRMKAIEKHFDQTLPASTQFIFNDLKLNQPEDVEELVGWIKKEGGADVVFIDTLACAMSDGDENSSRDMGAVVTGAKELQRAIGGLVVLVHHTGKDASRGLRGHSLLNAALDVCIEVKRHEDYRSWRVVKARDSEDGVQGAFKLEPVELRLDSNGAPVNSIVVVPTDVPDEQERASTPAYKNQSAALKILKAHFEAQEPADDSDLTSIDRIQAIDIVKEAMESGPRHRKSRASEAIEGLVKANFLIEIDDRLSLPDEPIED